MNQSAISQSFIESFGRGRRYRMGAAMIAVFFSIVMIGVLDIRLPLIMLLVLPLLAGGLTMALGARANLAETRIDSALRLLPLAAVVAGFTLFCLWMILAAAYAAPEAMLWVALIGCGLWTLRLIVDWPSQEANW